MKFNHLTLKFNQDDARLEDKFLEHDFKYSLKLTRISFLLGLALYALFGMLDAVLAGENKNIFWLIRYVIVCPVFLFLFFASFSQLYERFWQVSMAFAIFIAGLGIIVMIVFAPEAVSFTYYAGLILVIIYCYTFFRMRFIWAAITCWTILILYEIVAVFFWQTPMEILINNNFFFIGANIIGMVACYYSEFYRRNNFFLMDLLENEKKKVTDVNANLAAKITELEDASAHIQTLKGLIPICANCKKVRDDKGYWNRIEEYIGKHSEAEFSHGICPDCIDVLYPDFKIDHDSEKNEPS